MEISQIQISGSGVFDIKDTVAREGLERKADLSTLENIKLAENVTWSDLTAKVELSGLVPGRSYRITDYVTKIDQPQYLHGSLCRSKEHQFDVIVTAISETRLDENARATIHDGDTYFDKHDYGVPAYAPYLTYKRVNIEAWELKYCLYNNDSRFAYADTENGKGVIWWLKDEWDNEAYYDFKNIQFFDGNEWCYTFNGKDFADMGLSESYDFSNDFISVTDTVKNMFDFRTGRLNECCGNKIGQYVHDVLKGGFCIHMLPNNIFKCGLTTVPVEEYPFLKFGVCKNNILGSGCAFNIFARDCQSNKLGDNCLSNYIDDGAIENTFGHSCNGNIIYDSCIGNTFEYGCQVNRLNSDSNYNKFAAYCIENKLDWGCYYNVFGSDCRSNQIGGNGFGNALGLRCAHNVFGANCSKNTFGNDCQGNTLNNNCTLVNVKDSIRDKNLQSIGVVGNALEPQYVGTTSNGVVVKKNPFDCLLSSDLSFTYDSNAKYIYLKAFNNNIGSVNCADFIKDGMLSTVELCGKTLVFQFNTDAGVTPISVNLSTFTDDYTHQISALTNGLSVLNGRVDVIENDYLKSSDKQEILDQCLSPDEITLYNGPGQKDISLSVGTGSVKKTFTASLSNFYLTSETSSATDLNEKFNEYYSKEQIGTDSLSDIFIWKNTSIDGNSLDVMILNIAQRLSVTVDANLLSDYEGDCVAISNLYVALGKTQPQLSNINQIISSLEYLEKETINLPSLSSKQTITNAILELNRKKKTTFLKDSVSVDVDTLKINKVSRQEYDILESSGSLKENELYVVDSDELDMKNNWILNVRTPEEDGDAANKQYVDSALMNSNIQIIRPYDQHDLNIRISISENPSLSSIINGMELDSALSNKYFYGFTVTNQNEAGWKQCLSSGFGREYNDKPIMFDFKQYAEDISYDFSGVKRLYMVYTWYYIENSVVHKSDPYSLVFPSITEVGANVHDVASKREFNVVNAVVTPEVRSVSKKSNYINVYKDQFSDIDTVITNGTKITLNEYNFSNSYRMSFKTAQSNNPISVDFYVDLGNGPEKDSTLNINNNKFNADTYYTIESKYDTIVVHSLNKIDVVNYLKENSNSVTLRVW